MSSLARSVRSRISLSPRTLGVKLTVWDKLAVTTIIILFAVHMTVSKTSLQLLTCTSIDKGLPPASASTATAAAGNASSSSAASEVVGAASLQQLPSGCPAEAAGRRLQGDLEVCCNDPESLAWMFGLGLPGVAVYALGIPLGMMWLLVRSRYRMEDPKVRATLGFLAAGLKPETLYWESVIMLRKASVAAVAVFLSPQGAAIQTYAALLVVFAMSMVHALVQPFALAVLNRLELWALVTAFVTFECGLFITSPEVSQVGKELTTVAIFVANVGFLVAVVGIVCLDRRRKRLSRRR